MKYSKMLYFFSIEILLRNINKMLRVIHKWRNLIFNMIWHPSLFLFPHHFKCKGIWTVVTKSLNSRPSKCLDITYWLPLIIITNNGLKIMWSRPSLPVGTLFEVKRLKDTPVVMSPLYTSTVHVTWNQFHQKNYMTTFAKSLTVL